VRLATHINTKAVFAVKIADVRERAVNGKAAVVVSSRRQGSVEREIRAWQMASTGSIPEITHLLEPFYSSGFYYMVCELCNKNLMQHLLHVKTISEEELGDLTAQMLRAIGHVHKVGLVHRDIKPENFLFGGDVLKLCDFGLALPQPKRGKKLKGIGGTAPYMAPEILVQASWLSGGYDKEIDMWAVGVILYLVLFGRFPYMPPGEATADSMKWAIKNDQPPLQFPESQASAALGMVRRLLKRRPQDRATAEQAQLDPFVAKATSSEARDLRVSVLQAKEVAERLKDFKVSQSTQQDLESRLKMVTAKSGGIWFSEGDEAVVTPQHSLTNSVASRADARIKTDKKPVSRDKFGTHSGVVSEQKQEYQDFPAKAEAIAEEPHDL